MRKNNFVINKNSRLTIIKELGIINKRRKVVCKCQCGKVKEMYLWNLTRNISCGCYAKEQVSKSAKTHGMTYTSEYASWKAMIERAGKNPTTSFKNYKEKGVKACERWYKFENFYEDMGNKPTPNHTIDRIDNDKGYYKENCRWATKRQQCQNRKVRLYLYKDNQKIPFAEYCEINNLHYEKTRRRFKRKKLLVKE